MQQTEQVAILAFGSGDMVLHVQAFEDGIVVGFPGPPFLCDSVNIRLSQIQPRNSSHVSP